MIIITLILICGVIGLGWYVYQLRTHQIEIISLNQENIQTNAAIERELIAKKQQLAELNTDLIQQHETLQSVIASTNDMREGARKQAQEEYEAKKIELEASLQAQMTAAAASLEKEISALVAEKELEGSKLQDLKDKQLAYLQAQQRQVEMEAKQDYYRLVISDDDKVDIELLRDIQKRFYKREAIDKLVWETYYKPAYDLLMSHLFTSNAKISGIYKITDLTTGLAYIGQSVDLKERFRQHIKASLSCDGATNKLYQTMQKSGQYNFTFEILEEVTKAKLNERETYWIDFYKTKEWGLNSTRGGS